MKKRSLAWALLAALLISCMNMTALAATGGKAAAESRQGVVRLIGECPDGSYSLGSGFGVGEVGEETEYFVTNRHVIYDLYELEDGTIQELPVVSLWIMKNNNAWNPATGLDTTQCIACEIVYVEEDGYPDVAIIKAVEKVPGRVALPLVDEDSPALEAGDSVFALGYPGISDFTDQTIYGSKLVCSVEDVTITGGVVSRITKSDTMGGARIIQHDTQMNPGNSGGPLVNEYGMVVGVNTYGLGDNQSFVSYHISEVIKILKAEGIPYEAGKLNDGLFLIIGIAAAVVVIAAILIVILLVSGKKKKAAPVREEPIRQEIPRTAPGGYQPTMAQDDRPRLQCICGAFAQQRFAIDGSVRIGRDPAKNDLIYPPQTQGISGVHCVVAIENGTVWLKDLGSTYGTFLSTGQRLAANEAVPLKFGDKFFLGSENEVFVIAPKGGI